MKVPDKIYLNKYMFRPYMMRPAQYPADTPDIEYIRKDALLEWAKNLKERWEEPPMSKHSPGCVFMLEQVINKLNKL